MTEKTRAEIIPIDHAEFVRIWQTSKTSKAVAEHFKITEQSAAGRASYMRTQKGIPLKRMGSQVSREGMDVDALKALCREHDPKNQKEEPEAVPKKTAKKKGKGKK